MSQILHKLVFTELILEVVFIISACDKDILLVAFHMVQTLKNDTHGLQEYSRLQRYWFGYQDPREAANRHSSDRV